jgi:hypothetical protein
MRIARKRLTVSHAKIVLVVMVIVISVRVAGVTATAILVKKGMKTHAHHTSQFRPQPILVLAKWGATGMGMKRKH